MKPDATGIRTPVIRYFVEGLPRFGGGVTGIDVLTAAFEPWLGYLNLQITLTSRVTDANVIISFDRVVGIPDNHVAMTDLGPPNGRRLRMVFDASKPWSVEGFRSCAAHEFGHILGIRHADIEYEGQLMNLHFLKTYRPQAANCSRDS